MGILFHCAVGLNASRLTQPLCAAVNHMIYYCVTIVCTNFSYMKYIFIYLRMNISFSLLFILILFFFFVDYYY